MRYMVEEDRIAMNGLSAVILVRAQKERGGLALPNNNDGNDGDNHKGKMPPALVPGKCPQRAG